ncbi:MAG: Wzt carbohydrate-binding domain-containing protein [Ilumatobacter sp.]|nr:Wzt carbohydrate-binding domain-containing protein [Ilumatobacter sp.]
MAAIEIDHVTKMYRRHGHSRRYATLKSALLTGSLAKDLRPEESFLALDDLSATIRKGVTYGVIGRNGSGKSTLLKLVAGITKPTRGAVRVNGRVSALIELGAGFHPEISGRENVFINGVMLGLSRREITKRFDEIVEFAEMEDFIDAPVKTYSSGMYMRLGFAVAINVDPDVLLVDEVLAVGDEGFSLKCLDKFSEFKRRGKTILLVTHGLSMVERFCDEALWINSGKKRLVGDPKRVVQMYLSDVELAEDLLLAAQDAKAQQTPVSPAPEGVTIESVVAAPEPEPQVVPDAGSEPQAEPDPEPDATSDAASEDDDAQPDDMFVAKEGRWGSGGVRIDQVTLVGDHGPAHVFHTGEQLTIRMQVHAPIEVDDFAFGISIFSGDGVCCYGTNTHIEEMKSKSLQGDATVSFVIDQLDLVGGTYKLDVAAHKRDGFSYDYHRLLYTFRVKSRTKDVGIYRPRHEWKFTDNIQFKPDTDGSSDVALGDQASAAESEATTSVTIVEPAEPAE